jgi:transcriptional regulator of acetoin/glycerol metabolism
VIELPHLLADSSRDQAQNINDASIANANNQAVIRLFDTGGHIKDMETIKKEAMEVALQMCDGHTLHAAKALGIGKSTFYRSKKK